MATLFQGHPTTGPTLRALHSQDPTPNHLGILTFLDEQQGREVAQSHPMSASPGIH